jgi:DNA-directed RNA polymerase II subunit RPB2
MTQENADLLLKLYFEQPKILYNHLFASYHQFIRESIPSTLLDSSSCYFYESVENNFIYIHGFECSNIKIKPPTFPNNNEIIFPHDARKNHLNYFASIIADVKQFTKIINSITNEETIKYATETEKEIPIGHIPIMVKSQFCSTVIKQDIHNECKIDPGGYFIVRGAEKIVMCSESMANNKVFVFTKKDTTNVNGSILIAQINSKKNDWVDNLQILTIKSRKDGVFVVSTSSQLVDIPFFIIMRALGIDSDERIISYITNDLNDIKMINLLLTSINNSSDDEGNKIYNKESAFEYLLTKIKRNKRISQSDEKVAEIQKKIYLEKILREDLLPHLGTDINKKIVFLGQMLNKLLNTTLNRQDIDDRDALHNKRVETPGELLGQLFRQNWKKMLNEIGKHFKKKNQDPLKPINVIGQIKPSTIEQGLKTALATGIWGMNKTKKGVAQALQRLSWIQSSSYLRRILSPSMDESTTKVTSIRHVSNNQTQMLCPIETPEGPKIGIVKSLAMTATITQQNLSQYKIITNLLKDNKYIKHPFDINPLKMNNYIKIFLNGSLEYVCKIKKSFEIFDFLKHQRKINVIDKFTSIVFNHKKKEILIYYDGGRLIRPVLIVNNNKINFTDEIVKDIKEELKLTDKTKSWVKILSKYPNLIEYEDIESLNFCMVSDNIEKLELTRLIKNNPIDYSNITNINRYGDYRWVNYTHCDLNQWTMLGTTCGNIPFSNHNYSTRNIIHFSQAKQSIGTYLTSYKDRMDISQVLYHPHVPLVSTQAMKYNGCLDLPYGENAIVAICSYTGFNQDDSIIINEGAIERGLFRADTLRKYSNEIMKNPSTSQDDIFTKPDRNKVTGMKQGNYDKLNERGFAPEETKIQDGDIIIGKISPIQPTGNNNKIYKDASQVFKSNVDGVIDRVHSGIYNSDGYEMYNVRVRMERKPMLGDKFTSFHGSKGSVGIIYPQKDMPFTESGIVPDLIFNPHGFPTRRALGHFIECIAGKQAAETGKFVDGTPFNNYDISQLPEGLKKLGYSPYGTETMYCGMTGRKMDVEIFIGPIYTVRLKHMVLDKVHARARGPKQALTRQPLEGRSRDGGLKIGRTFCLRVRMQIRG